MCAEIRSSLAYLISNVVRPIETTTFYYDSGFLRFYINAARTVGLLALEPDVAVSNQIKFILITTTLAIPPLHCNRLLRNTEPSASSAET